MKNTMTKKHEASAKAKINMMLKKAKKNKENLGYTWYMDGLQCATDGFRAYRLNTPITDLPIIPEGVQTVDLKEIFKNYELNADMSTPLPRPSTNELKALIAAEKTTKELTNILWDFGKGLPAVNASYLLDLLVVLPDAILLKVNTGSPYHFPVYAFSKYGDAILLPVLSISKREEFDALNMPEPAQIAQEPAQEAQEPVNEAQAEPQPEPQPAQETPQEPAQESQEPEDTAQAEPTTNPQKPYIGTAIKGKAWVIEFSEALNRTVVSLDSNADTKTLGKLKKAVETAKFYYSPIEKHYRKKLTNKAYRAAVELAAELRKISA